MPGTFSPPCGFTIQLVLNGGGCSPGIGWYNVAPGYSQLELNQLSPNGQPWVGAVVYQSTVDPSSYYLAFEDQPRPRRPGRARITSATVASMTSFFM